MNDQNNGRSPIEIKDGLVRCKDGRRCKQGDDQCPYHIECFMGYRAKRLIADTLAYIQYLEAVQPKWISVKDRLPMEGQLVLVYLGGYTGSLMELCSLDEFGGWVTDMRIAEDAPITHWMPLPEPPEVIENDA